jgi:hypothetical protein
MRLIFACGGAPRREMKDGGLPEVSQRTKTRCFIATGPDLFLRPYPCIVTTNRVRRVL